MWQTDAFPHREFWIHEHIYKLETLIQYMLISIVQKVTLSEGIFAHIIGDANRWQAFWHKYHYMTMIQLFYMIIYSRWPIIVRKHNTNLLVLLNLNFHCFSQKLHLLPVTFLVWSNDQEQTVNSTCSQILTKLKSNLWVHDTKSNANSINYPSLYGILTSTNNQEGWIRLYVCARWEILDSSCFQ